MRFIPKVCRYSKILLVCRNRRHCSSSRISDLCKYFQQFSSKIPSCIRTYLSSCSRLVEFSIRSGGNELTSFHVYFLCIWSGIKRVNNCFLLILIVIWIRIQRGFHDFNGDMRKMFNWLWRNGTTAWPNVRCEQWLYVLMFVLAIAFSSIHTVDAYNKKNGIKFINGNPVDKVSYPILFDQCTALNNISI